tara:strand:+ start:423 stop:656 length:234 start_codon:yes stop_codon:yes gene_type:complete
LVFEDIQADLSRGVYVAVVNPRSKGNFRRLEWVIVRVVNVEKENASIIRRACVFSMYFEEEEEERNVLVKKKTKKKR